MYVVVKRNPCLQHIVSHFLHVPISIIVAYKVLGDIMPKNKSSWVRVGERLTTLGCYHML